MKRWTIALMCVAAVGMLATQVLAQPGGRGRRQGGPRQVGLGRGGPARDFEGQDGPTGPARRGQRDVARPRGQAGQRGPAVDRPLPSPGPLMAAIDVNGDGVLNPREIANAAKAIAKLDTNQDGKVTRDEVRLLAARRRARRGDGPNAEGPRGLRTRGGQGRRAGQDVERPARPGFGQGMGPGPMGPRGQANGEGFQSRRGAQRGQATGPRGQRR